MSSRPQPGGDRSRRAHEWPECLAEFPSSRGTSSRPEAESPSARQHQFLATMVLQFRNLPDDRLPLLRRLVWTQERRSFVPNATCHVRQSPKRRPMELHREWRLRRKLPNALLDGLGRRSFLSASRRLTQRQHRENQEEFTAAKASIADGDTRTRLSRLVLTGFMNGSGGTRQADITRWCSTSLTTSPSFTVGRSKRPLWKRSNRRDQTQAGTEWWHGCRGRGPCAHGTNDQFRR